MGEMSPFQWIESPQRPHNPLFNGAVRQNRGRALDPRLEPIESGVGNPSVAMNQQEQMPHPQAGPIRTLTPHHGGPPMDTHHASIQLGMGNPSFAMSPRVQMPFQQASPNRPLPPQYGGQAMDPRLASMESAMGSPYYVMSPRGQMPFQQATPNRPPPPGYGSPATNPRLASIESGMGKLSIKPQEKVPIPQARPRRPPPPRPCIRPAVVEDAEEISRILDWHCVASPWDPEAEVMIPEYVCNFLETCKLRRLPFLVLVMPPDLSQTSEDPPKPQICGLTYIDAFDEIVTEDSLGDLRVYICPKWTRHGFGTALVDCILAICDIHYNRRVHMEWRSVPSVDLSNVLRLEQVMCAIAYPAQVEKNFEFIWHWLKKRFGFQLFGEVRQDRAKYGYEYVNVSFFRLIRTV